MKATYKPDFTEIQKYIITKLITNPELKYSEILDASFESDLFNYHLQQLVMKGIVVKKESIYSLSEKGMKITANMDVQGNIIPLFRVSVALITLSKIDNRDMILLQKRLRQPYLNDITSIAGKVHQGELIENAASRKLKEESGLIATYRLIGIHRKMRYSVKQELLEDIIFHICVTNETKGQLILKNEYGENFWDTIDSAIEYESKNKGASDIDIDILKKVQNSKILDIPFFYIEDKMVIKEFN